METSTGMNTRRLEVLVTHRDGHYYLHTEDNPLRPVACKDDLYTVLATMLQDYLHSSARIHLAPIDNRFMDQLLHLTMDRGFVTSAATDILTKNRTYEITLHVGTTRWSPPSGENGDDEHVKLLIYYDRTSGVWQLLS